ncbi:MAG: energy-coupling factor transporter transmembrane component T [Bacillota bacterium]
MLLFHPLVLLALLLPLVLALAAAGGLAQWRKSLKYFLIMIFLSMIINITVNKMGATVLWLGPVLPFFGRFIITLESLFFGLVMGCRLLIVFSAFILYNLVLNPDRALFAFAKIFPRSAMLVALTAKTIPYLGQQMQRAAEIQQCRGINYYRGNLANRINNRLPLIKVLFLSALEDSFNLGESIQARAYGSGSRSCYFRSSPRPRDYFVLSASLGAALLLLWLLLKGEGSFQFFPRMRVLILSGGQVAAMVYICLLLLVPVLLSWGWSKWDYLKWKI